MNLDRAIPWLLWKERNSRVFTDKSSSLLSFCDLVQFTASTWSAQHRLSCNYSIDTINFFPSEEGMPYSLVPQVVLFWLLPLE